MKLSFRRNYFLLFLFLFVVESLIALYAKDDFIRPFMGDFLVVILIYAFVKSFFDFSPTIACIGTLLLSYLIEFLQYLNLLEYLGWQDSQLAHLTLGNTFHWGDMLAYSLGALCIYLWERSKTKQLAKA